jgi:hypothetical protein
MAMSHSEQTKGILMNLPDVAIEEITPNIAAAYLATSPGNRRLNQAQVSVYVDDMKAGRWRIGNDALIFDKQGRLRNAHHRLTAVVLAGVTIKMIVRRNVPDDEIPTIDQGRPRNVKAALGDFGCGQYGEVENYHGATLRHVLYGSRPQKMAMAVLGEAMKDARDGLDFVFKECFDNRKKRGISAPTYAVFVRMYYFGISKDKLIYAARVLLDGDVPDGQAKLEGHQSLIVLRDYLMSEKARGGGIRTDIYEKSQNMLNAFVQGENRRSATATSRDIYPVPSKLKKYVKDRTVFDAEATIAIRKMASKFSHCQTFTIAELGTEMVKTGYRARSSDPNKYAATAFSRLLKQNDRILFIDGIGRFLPDSNEELQRVKIVRFEKLEEM